MTMLTPEYSASLRDPKNALEDLRRKLGPIYGGEYLATLFHSLIRRERPRTVLELGTGLGVTTAWLASAVKENGIGRVYTYDNGSQFEGIRNAAASLLQEVSWPATSETKDYARFLEEVWRRAGVDNEIEFRLCDIDVRALSAGSGAIEGQGPVDMVFADYDHSPGNVVRLLGYLLPLLSDSGSVFVDSAPTHIPTHELIQRVLAELNSGSLTSFSDLGLGEEQHSRIRRLSSTSYFSYMPMIESEHRKQNSTAWIKALPRDLRASGFFLH
ncbi:class I SAM-dependent methyltransferase [Luteibacter aegosomatis]|uniref:class I SAM-dependent methyltransferase n=1 Tax=Luteibacter aegosomatis TaxID=2911537 RepID=UPI001FFB33D6|nr:class I SAM-dependent methyltransferase [Luteibacter aegosomatis]UPG87455.1 class I SAM-dependent methyltransferase [Luteibacter aegosomatis]